MLGPGGILLVDKPSGVTSFRVVDHVRKQLLLNNPELQSRRRSKGGPKHPRFKCGHAGTLDPLATGLLVVLVGKGSRLSPFLMGLDKTYAATVRFGAVTDTLDREGEIVRQVEVPADPAILSDVLPGFLGDIMQVPPLISALKRDGKALYKRVRAGEDVAEPESRPVTISRFDLLDTRWGEKVSGEVVHEADFEVSCSSGTYIRSLARDLALAAGSEGHIQELRRLQVGPFGLADSVTGIMAMDGTAMIENMLPLAAALPQVPVLTLDEIEAAAVRQGTQPLVEWLDRLDGIPVNAGKAGLVFRMLDTVGDLVAVGKVDQETNLPSIAAVIPKAENDPGDSTCD